ncbi:hypothetical protein [Alkalihalobacillus sp. 1P02AB]|uniref:hypothetical protein n=1 Tax=Alkalihalobacillus sp. 1P02AB TaxID=3132260 RepID=UPI0039A6B2EB
MLKNWKGEPTYLKSIGNVYPIRVRDYDEFMKLVSILTLNYNHFDVDHMKKTVENEDLKLLDLLGVISISDPKSNVIDNLIRLFKLVMRIDDVKLISSQPSYQLAFKVGSNVIHSKNYDALRELIMQQNLIFEPPVFKSKIKQEWAEMVLRARAKNGIDMDIEEFLTTIQVASGKHPSELLDYTVYQIRSEFARVNKIKSYEANLAMIGHAKEISKLHFAEKTNISSNPYDGLFVSGDKLSNIKESIK